MTDDANPEVGPVPEVEPAGIDALPRALAWRVPPNSVVYLHPLDGHLAVIGWHSESASSPVTDQDNQHGTI